MKIKKGLNILLTSKFNFIFSISLILYLFIYFGNGYSYSAEVEFFILFKTFFYWLIMESLLLLCICIIYRK